MTNFKKALDSAKDAKEKGNTKPLYAMLTTFFRVLRNTRVPFFRRKVAKAINRVKNEIKN